jgi:hypothetical protein
MGEPECASSDAGIYATMKDGYDLGVTGCDFFGSTSKDRIGLEESATRALNSPSDKTSRLLVLDRDH